jgi:hypothetical protein
MRGCARVAGRRLANSLGGSVPVTEETTQRDINEFRLNFDDMYIRGIRLLLNEDGMFLAFLAMLTATEALSGVFAPHLGTGERFRLFVNRFFQAPSAHADQRQSRSLIVHAFNQGPFAVVTSSAFICRHRSALSPSTPKTFTRL